MAEPAFVSSLKGTTGNLPGTSSSSNNDRTSSKIAERSKGEHPRVTTKYFVADNWGYFVEKEDARLCSRCQAFSERLPRIAAKLLLKKSENCEELRATTESLESSANSGCPLCAMLVMVLGYYPPEQRVCLDPISFRCGRVRDGIELRCKLNCSSRSPLKIQPSSRVISDPETLLNTSFEGNPPLPRLLGASTDSDFSMKKAREWYDGCRNSHPNCIETLGRTLPTRLLQYKNGYLRLCNGVDLDISTRYATLSHCWGELPMFKLTTERVSLFQIKIEIEDLSQTFQDALQALARLGLEFLWIDSLCILQDDPDDWNRESLLMSSVFGYSDITISAASSTDGSQGCFYKRMMPVEHLLYVSIGSSHSSGCKTYNVSHPPNPEIDWLPPVTLINRSPLFSRGWVCQERILSPRLLHFSSSYLYWQCAFWNGPEWKTPGVDEPQDPHENVGQDFDWRHIVKACSSSHLTFPTDRLVSISGMAKNFQKVSPDGYFAGMWRKDLEHSLCWSIATPQLANPLEYQAPSWSWASTVPGTRVDPPRKSQGIEVQYIKVVDVDMTLAGPDPMGAVTRGVLRIRCEALLSGISLSGERDYFLATIGFVLVTVKLKFDSVIANATPFYLLPVSQDPGKQGNRVYMQGLILRPTNRCIGEYERIGLFRKDDSPGANTPKLFRKTGKMDWRKFQYPKLDRELLFESSEGEQGPHFITII